MKKELPAVQKAYDLCKEVLPRVSKLSRNVKFTLGDRITDNCHCDIINSAGWLEPVIHHGDLL
jgi:hypothetical protein